MSLEELVEACATGDAEELSRLLGDDGGDADLEDDFGNSLVHLACLSGHADTGSVLRVLHDAGADMNANNARCRTALHIMIKKPELLQLLCELGCDPMLVDEDGLSPVHMCAQEGLTQSLIVLVSASTEAVGPNSIGLTPLHCAAGAGHGDIVSALLELRADLIDAVTQDGDTALMLACEAGQIKCARTLTIAGANPKSRNKEGKSCTEICNEFAQRDGTKAAWSLAEFLRLASEGPEERAERLGDVIVEAVTDEMPNMLLDWAEGEVGTDVFVAMSVRPTLDNVLEMLLEDVAVKIHEEAFLMQSIDMLVENVLGDTCDWMLGVGIELAEMWDDVNNGRMNRLITLATDAVNETLAEELLEAAVTDHIAESAAEEAVYRVVGRITDPVVDDVVESALQESFADVAVEHLIDAVSHAEIVDAGVAQLLLLELAWQEEARDLAEWDEPAAARKLEALLRLQCEHWGDESAAATKTHASLGVALLSLVGEHWDAYRHCYIARERTSSALGATHTAVDQLVRLEGRALDVCALDVVERCAYPSLDTAIDWAIDEALKLREDETEAMADASVETVFDLVFSGMWDACSHDSWALDVAFEASQIVTLHVADELVENIVEAQILANVDLELPGFVADIAVSSVFATVVNDNVMSMAIEMDSDTVVDICLEEMVDWLVNGSTQLVGAVAMREKYEIEAIELRGSSRQMIDEGRIAGAEPKLKRLVEVLAFLHGPESDECIRSRVGHGVLLMRLRRYIEAFLQIREGRVFTERRLGDDSEVTQSIVKQEEVAMEQGAYELMELGQEALLEFLYDEALERIIEEQIQTELKAEDATGETEQSIVDALFDRCLIDATTGEVTATLAVDRVTDATVDWLLAQAHEMVEVDCVMDRLADFAVDFLSETLIDAYLRWGCRIVSQSHAVEKVEQSDASEFLDSLRASAMAADANKKAINAANIANPHNDNARRAAAEAGPSGRHAAASNASASADAVAIKGALAQATAERQRVEEAAAANAAQAAEEERIRKRRIEMAEVRARIEQENLKAMKTSVAANRPGALRAGISVVGGPVGEIAQATQFYSLLSHDAEYKVSETGGGAAMAQARAAHWASMHGQWAAKESAAAKISTTWAGMDNETLMGALWSMRQQVRAEDAEERAAQLAERAAMARTDADAVRLEALAREEKRVAMSLVDKVHSNEAHIEQETRNAVTIARDRTRRADLAAQAERNHWNAIEEAASLQSKREAMITQQMRSSNDAGQQRVREVEAAMTAVIASEHSRTQLDAQQWKRDESFLHKDGSGGLRGSRHGAERDRGRGQYSSSGAHIGATSGHANGGHGAGLGNPSSGGHRATGTQSHRDRDGSGRTPQCGFCDVTDDGAAVARCNDCRVLLCDLHFKEHAVSRAYRGHSCVPIAQVSLSEPHSPSPRRVLLPELSKGASARKSESSAKKRLGGKDRVANVKSPSSSSPVAGTVTDSGNLRANADRTRDARDGSQSFASRLLDEPQGGTYTSGVNQRRVAAEVATHEMMRQLLRPAQYQVGVPEDKNSGVYRYDRLYGGPGRGGGRNTVGQVSASIADLSWNSKVDNAKHAIARHGKKGASKEDSRNARNGSLRGSGEGSLRGSHDRSAKKEAKEAKRVADAKSNMLW